MKCCGECIGDRNISREIIPSLSRAKGRCSYCGNDNRDVVEPIELREYFEALLGIYIQDPTGKPLVELLREDWAIFDNEHMDTAHAKDLLSEILDDGEIVRQKFKPSAKCFSNSLKEWRQLREELKHKNRFFPETTIDLDRLSSLFPHLITVGDELPEVWYRARIQEGLRSFQADQMGAPPANLASHGRANPVGIPYLYLASSKDTALSEIRPHTGERVSLGEFPLPQYLKYVDLRHPKKTVSPFILEDEAEVATLRGDIQFLERLGNELSRPVLPKSAAIDYIPSQFLCELIKRNGFDGVLYGSSVGTGFNVAVFRAGAFSCHSVETCLVSRVSVEFEEG